MFNDNINISQSKLFIMGWNEGKLIHKMQDIVIVIEQLRAGEEKQASPAHSVLFPNQSSTLTNPQQFA